MSFCSYVLMLPALAAAKPRYGVTPLAYYHTDIFAYSGISILAARTNSLHSTLSQYKQLKINV